MPEGIALFIYAYSPDFLFILPGLQPLHLLAGQEPPRSALEVLLRETRIVNAVEFGHGVPQELENTAHDAVAARVDLDAHLLLVLLDVGNLVGEDLAVFERDALGDAVHVGARQGFVERHLVDFLLLVGRVRQLLRKVAVVGEQQQPEAVLVETSHRVDALRAGARDQLHDRLSGMGIVERSDVALGLVQHQVDLLLALHRLVVEPHFVGRQHLGSQFGDDLAVDRNDARRDEIVGLAARADTRLGDEAVQAHLARLLLGIEFRIRRRFVVVFLIGRFERFVDELPVAEFLIPEFFLAELLLAVGLVAELLGSEFLLAVGRLVAVTAARTLLVAAVTVTVVAGFVAEGTPRTVVVLTLTVAIRTRLIVILTRTVAIGTRAVVIRTARAVALPAGFVAVVRLLEDRTVVGREMWKVIEK